jgi:DNA polymerase sigma
MDVDVTVNNILSVYNSQLIKTYCQVDERFHKLAIYLKYWAKKNKIIGANRGYLSSYAWTLLIIGFL